MFFHIPSHVLAPVVIRLPILCVSEIKRAKGTVLKVHTNFYLVSVPCNRYRKRCAKIRSLVIIKFFFYLNVSTHTSMYTSGLNYCQPLKRIRAKPTLSPTVSLLRLQVPTSIPLFIIVRNDRKLRCAHNYREKIKRNCQNVRSIATLAGARLNWQGTVRFCRSVGDFLSMITTISIDGVCVHLTSHFE